MSERRVNIIQGEHHVTSDGSVVLTTILGSCVAACLHDPVTRIGGMNHFLLPGDDEGNGSTEQGVHAMELLVNGLLQIGARRERLQAKLFGGARMVKGLTDVGSLNAAFAERFAQRERIVVTGGSLRGEFARRIQYWPCTGRARQFAVQNAASTVFASERSRPQTMPDSGALELF